MLRVPDTRYVFLILQLRPVRQIVVRVAGCVVRLRLCLVPHRPGDDERGLRGGVPQGGIVEMGVDGGGVAPAMPEHFADRGQADAVHYRLRSPCVTAVVDAEARQSGLLANFAPEAVQQVGGQSFGKDPHRVFIARQLGDELGGVRAEPDGARSGLGVGQPGGCTVLGQCSDLVPAKVKDFGQGVRRSA